VLAHVRQHDTPEHNVGRLAPARKGKDLARPVLLGHSFDDSSEACPASLDLGGGLVLRHSPVLACIDGIQLVRRLPLEFERLLARQGSSDESRLPSKPQADVVGNDDDRPGLARARDPAVIGGKPPRDQERLVDGRLERR
jgi:hypothetical protein